MISSSTSSWPTWAEARSLRASSPGTVLPVQGRDDGLEGGASDRAVDANAPEDAVTDLALDVGRGQGVIALGQGVLGVVQDPHLDLVLGQCLDEAVEGTVADPGDFVLLAVDHQRHGDAVGAVTGGFLTDVAETEAAPAPALVGGGQVLVGEAVPQLLGSDLAALGVGEVLDDAGELDLQAARQLQAVLGAQQVRSEERRG